MTRVWQQVISATVDQGLRMLKQLEVLSDGVRGGGLSYDAIAPHPHPRPPIPASPRNLPPTIALVLGLGWDPLWAMSHWA